MRFSFELFSSHSLINEAHHAVSPGENVDDEKPFSFGATKGILVVWTIGWRDSSGATGEGPQLMYLLEQLIIIAHLYSQLLHWLLSFFHYGCGLGACFMDFFFTLKMYLTFEQQC